MKRLFALICLSALSATIVHAHNLWGMANPKLNDQELVSQSEANELANQQISKDGRYIYERLLLWPPGKVLRACFFNGNDQDRAKVVRAVNNLRLAENKVNLSVDFGTSPTYNSCDTNSTDEIRYSFDDGCCFGYLGRNALHPKLKGLPTIYIARNVPDYIIQHETLHAFAVDHEHQNPVGIDCYEELADPAAYAQKQGWDVGTVKSNLRKFGADSRRFAWSSTLDTKSETFYDLEASDLKRGKDSPCYVGANTRPSAGDYQGLREAYPMGAGGQQLAGRRRAVGAAFVPASAPPKFRNLIQTLSSE